MLQIVKLLGKLLGKLHVERSWNLIVGNYYIRNFPLE
jgi:hypothetical protein